MKITDLVTDNSTRIAVEAKARADADKGEYVVPYPIVDGTYQRQSVLGAVNILYVLAHQKRVARIDRMKKMAA